MQKAREHVLQTEGAQPIKRFLLHPFQEFLNAKTSSGILLIVCTLVALIWANSPWASSYEALWETHLVIGLEGAALDFPLHIWINDGLMVIFFLLVGLELKREFLVGELSAPKQALLPILAAVGGALLPAGIYTLFNLGTDRMPGWGIPMATDIAFALGMLALLGDRVPFGLKVFLTALAIVDDLFAVLVIAIFYSHGINMVALGLAGVVILVLIGAGRFGIRSRMVYSLLGVALWLAFLHSGIHATIAGVILAFCIPVRARIDEKEFVMQGRSFLEEVELADAPGHGLFMNNAQQTAVQALETACEHVQAPLLRLEHTLHTFVSFVIIPLFVLANAGVHIDPSTSLLTPVSLGVILGLILGKQIGITVFAWLAVKLRWADLPGGVTWYQMYGVSWLGGIGFTMSLFIASLAFGSEQAVLLTEAKIGILVAALIAGGIGYVILHTATSTPAQKAPPDEESVQEA